VLFILSAGVTLGTVAAAGGAALLSIQENRSLSIEKTGLWIKWKGIL
jgi:hypothetical protein